LSTAAEPTAIGQLEIPKVRSHLEIVAASSFFRTRWLARRVRDRAALDRYQAGRLAALQAHVGKTMDYYRPWRGQPFDVWPVIDKAELTACFAGMNLARIDATAVRTAIANGEERVRGFVVGQSTGTSGNRGYYLISDAERFVWLGTILAKTLPDALWRRHKVALALPGLSSLYRSASSGSRISLGFFDLAEGVERWADDLAAFAPDTIVAPPKVLRWLAEHGRLHTEHIFSGAEVLDPLDRAIIEAATGRTVREIYMATEGLFGVSCPLGVLHLAEDVVHFEWSRPAPDSVLQSPIVTDFTRRSQALVRYRMNDLLELADEPCLCGSPYRAVRRIEGRADDIFHLAGGDGRTRMVTPDVVRNAIVDSHPAIQDFRAVQTGPAAIRVSLAADLPDAIVALVKASLTDRLAASGAAPEIVVSRGIGPSFDRKLRRVRREFG
jgi:putative adenylate-forming enzyme